MVDMSIVSHPSAFNAYEKLIQNDLTDTNKICQQMRLNSLFHKKKV